MSEALRKSTVERAFELARGGECRSVDEIRRVLTAERYDSVMSHLSGPSLIRQLRAAITAAAPERTTTD